VVVLADDLDVRTSEQLPRIEAFARGGLAFSRAYVTQSLCAPSRVSLLTGLYSHNHGAVFNSSGFPDFHLSGGEAQTVAVWLKRSGYRTGLIGKYLNGYPLEGRPEYIPPGWDEWAVHLTAQADGRYYNYSLNENGRIVEYRSGPEDYDTDVVARKAVEFVRRASGEPFFLLLGLQAPHAPATYPDRHGDAFARAEAPRVPSFNEEDIRDKPAWIHGFPMLRPVDILRLDQLQRARLRSMLAVEDLLDDVLSALAAAGQLANSYVLFTSDNGLMLGEHRLAGLKGNSFEECIRVPLLVRGPGVPAGRELLHPVLNIDLAPTLADLAGVPVPDPVDGRSIAPLLRAGPPPLDSWRTDFLVEAFSTGVSASLRNRDYLYTELESGELELYDMRGDPYQMDSIHRTADRALMDDLSRRLAALLRCRGASCRQ
jgi:arylsulfatase A-like enzyme